MDCPIDYFLLCLQHEGLSVHPYSTHHRAGLERMPLCIGATALQLQTAFAPHHQPIVLVRELHYDARLRGSRMSYMCLRFLAHSRRLCLKIHTPHLPRSSASHVVLEVSLIPTPAIILFKLFPFPMLVVRPLP